MEGRIPRSEQDTSVEVAKKCAWGAEGWNYGPAHVCDKSKRGNEKQLPLFVCFSRERRDAGSHDLPKKPER